MGLFDRKASQPTNVWDNLKNTKLTLPLMEIRVLEFCQIELLANAWLKDAGIDYAALERTKAWIILVSAWFSMRYADLSHEIRTRRADEHVAEVYSGLIKVGMPYDAFRMICRDIDMFQRTEEAMRLKSQLKTSRGFSEFEAQIMILCAFVSSSITDDEAMLDKIQDNLYQFFLRARDDYFAGK